RKTPLRSQPQKNMKMYAAMNARTNRFTSWDVDLSSHARIGLVDRADHCAGNRELDQVTGNPAAEDLGRQRLYRESDQVSAGIYQRYQDSEHRAGACATCGDKSCIK